MSHVTARDIYAEESVMMMQNASSDEKKKKTSHSPFLLKVLCFENLTADMHTFWGDYINRGLINKILMFFE